MGMAISFMSYLLIAAQILFWYRDDIQSITWMTMEMALVGTCLLALLFTFYWPNIPAYILLGWLAYHMFHLYQELSPQDQSTLCSWDSLRTRAERWWHDKHPEPILVVSPL